MITFLVPIVILLCIVGVLMSIRGVWACVVGYTMQGDRDKAWLKNAFLFAVGGGVCAGIIAVMLYLVIH